MKAITIIFPHQLFERHPALQPGRTVYLIEETLFFNQYKFHCKKLMLHRASMKTYADFLGKENYTVKYIEAVSGLCDVRNLIEQLSLENVTDIHIADVVDNWLQRRITESCKKYSVNLVQYN